MFTPLAPSGQGWLNPLNRGCKCGIRFGARLPKRHSGTQISYTLQAGGANWSYNPDKRSIIGIGADQHHAGLPQCRGELPEGTNRRCMALRYVRMSCAASMSGVQCSIQLAAKVEKGQDGPEIGWVHDLQPG
jgi:hypothetical protein